MDRNFLVPALSETHFSPGSEQMEIHEPGPMMVSLFLYILEIPSNGQTVVFPIDLWS